MADTKIQRSTAAERAAAEGVKTAVGGTRARFEEVLESASDDNLSATLGSAK